MTCFTAVLGGLNFERSSQGISGRDCGISDLMVRVGTIHETMEETDLGAIASVVSGSFYILEKLGLAGPERLDGRLDSAAVATSSERPQSRKERGRSTRLASRPLTGTAVFF